MDINLGTATLTANQLERSEALKTGIIRGFSYKHKTGEVVVVTTSELSEQEKTDLLQALNDLPDTELQKTKDRRTAKKAVKTKLGLTNSDLKALVDLINDGDDD